MTEPKPTLAPTNHEDLAAFFSILGDPTRLQILYEIKNGEKNVSDLSDRLHLSISAISHQLKLLRDHDLVRVRRAGKYSYYRISDDHVRYIIQVGQDHLAEPAETKKSGRLG